MLLTKTLMPDGEATLSGWAGITPGQPIGISRPIVLAADFIAYKRRLFAVENCGPIEIRADDGAAENDFVATDVLEGLQGIRDDVCAVTMSNHRRRDVAIPLFDLIKFVAEPVYF